jgi:predicted anti-sigma-YlaC factor YlaD
MNKEYCEKIRISAMAILDGEVPQLPEKDINKHLESCADCRLELEQQKQAAGLLDGQNRRVFTEDISPRVAAAVEAAEAGPKQPANVPAFVIFCLFLIAYKIIEVLPAVTPGVVIKMMPLLVILLFFSLLKQNPFTINQNLRLEGDIR